MDQPTGRPTIVNHFIGTLHERSMIVLREPTQPLLFASTVCVAARRLLPSMAHDAASACFLPSMPLCLPSMPLPAAVRSVRLCGLGDLFRFRALR